jgi:hypothetical protein
MMLSVEDIREVVEVLRVAVGYGNYLKNLTKVVG